MARYEGLAAWYDEFRPALRPHESGVLERLLGHGTARCLDLACGSGVALPILAELGWSVVGVDIADDLLELARRRGIGEILRADVTALPFPDASFDAAVSIWTHTDVDDFSALLREAVRVLKPGARFVYLGAHPCFVGPHSTFVGAEGIPLLHPGYRRTGRYLDAPGIQPEGVRARVGATHLPLGLFLQAFLDTSLTVETVEEPDDREYPYTIAVAARR